MNKILMYTIELDIGGLDQRLVKCMKAIGRNHDYDVFHHGYDRLVFTSDNFNDFTGLVNELSTVCKMYSVDYLDLLV